MNEKVKVTGESKAECLRLLTSHAAGGLVGRVVWVLAGGASSGTEKQDCACRASKC